MGDNTRSRWTEDRIVTLRQLWKDGLSGSQIARQLGGVTRNAVIGKVHRMGLSAPDSGRKDRLDIAVSIPKPKPKPIVPTPKPEPNPYKGPGVRISDDSWGDKRCKWPLPEDASGFIACGAPSLSDSPYCYEHSRIAYNGRPVRVR